MFDARDESRGWHVHLSVSAQEGGHLLEAASASGVEQGASLIVSADSELKELVLFSRENDADRARDAVTDVYQRLRRVAGLDAQPTRVVSLERPSRKRKLRHPRHRLDVRLMNEAARVLNAESHFEWAVVLAQTACEVYVRDILERRAAQLGEAVIDSVARLPSTNLANNSVRDKFQEITGYTPDEADWWPEYQAHAQRRHRIVHAGARITRRDAEDSLEAAKELIAVLHWPSLRIDAERK
jgi:hypothetical protein